ncbi:ABC transporter [Hamiltosporidium magnivora]|uniref:ABC transporter n=1 Tax=Hamiltosporidium magnivora TaxID=148818 RepID=A0A4Q9L9T8_9MICR|nr:ABC transporter [Hamiltosporidium magnivora]
MNLEWKNVDIELVNKNKNRREKYVRLITNANGIVKAGSLCAIMGPSGSGKTTLIKGLVGRIPSGAKTKGDILVNGKARDYENWCKNIGYVDQDDCIYEKLTVLETVTYAARFRLKEQNINILKKVEDLLDELDILDISGSRMDSISGGERKRVMIAIELITQPNILFMDEPTSGLDSSTAFNFVKLMQTLSITHKMTVIFTIHQPSVETFSIFDQLILLSDSHTVFSGQAENAEEYFESYGLKKRELSTFPDFLAEVLKVKHKYRELPEHQAILTKMINDVEIKYHVPENMAISDQNEIAMSYIPNKRHIMILLNRKYKTNFSISKVLFSLVIIGLSFYSFILTAFGLLEKENSPKIITTYFIINQAVHDETFFKFANFVQIYGDKVSAVLKPSIFMQFLGILFAYSMIASTGVFSFEYKMVKRELGVATYSIGSYYFATFLFEIFFYLPFFILINIISAILQGSLIPWEFYLFVIFGLLAFIPVILFFGSLTKRTKTIYVIVSFLALTWAVPPVFYVRSRRFFTDQNCYPNIFFMLIGSIFPPLHFKALCVALSYKFSSQSSDILKENDSIRSTCDQLSANLYSYLYNSMAIWQILLLFVITTVFYVVFALVALTLRLKPEQRFKLSK